MNSEEEIEKLTEKDYSDVSDYQMIIQPQSADEVSLTTRTATRYNELSDEQKENYKVEISRYKMKKKMMKKMTIDLRIMNSALKSLVKSYISFNKMTSSVREIVKILTTRYKQSND